jgi:hypothetical protein
MMMKLKYLKRRLRFNKKRSYFFLFLFLLVCSVGLGYAAISTTLSIDGSAEFKDARWNVYFDNLNVTTGSITATTPASITNTTTVSFGAKLENPGDFYEFTVDVVNGGNMNAMIESVNVLPELTAAQQNYLSYTVTYSDGVALASKQKLDVGSTETLKVRFEYLENADASLYPTEDDNLTIAFDVTYVQADSNTQDIGHLNGIIYTGNRYIESEPGYNSVWMHKGYPTNITYYETPEGAINELASNSSLNLLSYVKHKVEKGIVTESYVEFIITEDMAQDNPGMVPGTYSLRAYKSYDPITSSWLVEEGFINPYYESNIEVMKTAFGYATDSSRCAQGDEGRHVYYQCSVNGLFTTSWQNGGVTANIDDFSYCRVGNYGYGYCFWQ